LARLARERDLRERLLRRVALVSLGLARDPHSWRRALRSERDHAVPHLAGPAGRRSAHALVDVAQASRFALEDLVERVFEVPAVRGGPRLLRALDAHLTELLAHVGLEVRVRLHQLPNDLEHLAAQPRQRGLRRLA